MVASFNRCDSIPNAGLAGPPQFVQQKRLSIGKRGCLIDQGSAADMAGAPGNVEQNRRACPLSPLHRCRKFESVGWRDAFIVG
jgi:hypothetical protein